MLISLLRSKMLVLIFVFCARVFSLSLSFTSFALNNEFFWYFQLIKLSWIPSISQQNQNSTRFNTNCSQCNKILQRAGWLCDRCHSSEYALCSVCHNVVKGLYVWCQGCSHGGHLAHMREWYSQNRVCPTGCGHSCEFTWNLIFKLHLPYWTAFCLLKGDLRSIPSFVHAAKFDRW